MDIHLVLELRSPIIVKVLKEMHFMNKQIFRKHLKEFYPLITKLKCCDEALSKIPNHLVSVPSPFRNLTYVKRSRGYKESSIRSALRSFLLGGSPRARSVTELPQGNTTPQTATVSVTAENAAPEEPLAAPTKGLADCQYIDKTVNVDTVDMGIQEQHVVENSLIDADRVNQEEDLIKN